MSKSKTFLHGIVPPVATPYTADNQIDWKAILACSSTCWTVGARSVLAGIDQRMCLPSPDERARRSSV